MKKYILTINTKREMTEQQWQDYKSQLSFLGVDFGTLEMVGKVLFLNHFKGEDVKTIYTLKKIIEE